MIVPDVNVLVYAARAAAPEHAAYRAWLEGALAGVETIGVSELVLSGVIRVLTHPRVFQEPLLLGDALAFTDALRQHPNVVPLRPGVRHCNCSLHSPPTRIAEGTWSPTHTTPRSCWRMAARGSQAIGISRGSLACAGGIR